jgi:hypothetical protein
MISCTWVQVYGSILFPYAIALPSDPPLLPMPIQTSVRNGLLNSANANVHLSNPSAPPLFRISHCARHSVSPRSRPSPPRWTLPSPSTRTTSMLKHDISARCTSRPSSRCFSAFWIPTRASYPGQFDTQQNTLQCRAHLGTTTWIISSTWRTCCDRQCELIGFGLPALLDFVFMFDHVA